MSKIFGQLSLACLAFVLGSASSYAQAPPRDDSKGTLDRARQLNEVSAQKLESEVREALQDAQRLLARDAAKAAEKLKKVLLHVEDDEALKATRRAALKRMLKEQIRAAEIEVERAAKADLSKAERTARNQRNDDRRVEETKRPYSATDDAKELTDRARARIKSTADRVGESKLLDKDRERRTANVYRDIDRSSTPPADDVNFDKEASMRSAKRVENKLTGKERAILKALDTRVTLDLKGKRFEDVIDYLSTLTGQTIIIDKPALDDAQVTYDSPVNVKVRNLSVRGVLRRILGDLNLSYTIRDEAIEITSAVRAKETLTTRTYYLGDLLAANTDPRLGPLYNRLATLRTAKEIIELIQSNIEPQSWEINGGPGKITFEPATMSLVVRQTAEIHFQLLGHGAK